MLTDKITKMFEKPFVLGMIHLTGNDKMRRVREEFDVFAREGINGVIVENLRGSVDDVRAALNELKKEPLPIGVRLNGVPVDEALQLAYGHNASFVQLEHVAGKYVQAPEGIPDTYDTMRKLFPHIPVIGGVHPKGFTPLPDSCLMDEVVIGMTRADGIVVTGDKIGDETPMERIMQFKSYLLKHPLIVGSGVTVDNVYEQLRVADGAIIGGHLKVNGVIENPVDSGRVKAVVQVVAQVRAYVTDRLEEKQKEMKRKEELTKQYSPSQS